MYRPLAEIRFFLSFVLLCNAQLGWSQVNAARNWYFGDSCGLVFGDSVYSTNQYKDWTYEGTAVISDSSGNLMYYSNGIRLYDSAHQLITNKLKGGWSSCQQIVLFVEGNNIEALTTSPISGASTDGYHYSIIDTDSGRFIVKNKLLIDRVGEKQAYCSHQDNISHWVAVHSLENDSFYIFKHSESGLICCPVITKKGDIYADEFPSQGMLKFSSDGLTLISANWNNKNFEIFHFNSQLGIISERIRVPHFYPYSVEFSPNQKYLFVTDKGQNIYRYDISELQYDSILNSKTLIYSQQYPKFGQMQLGPDNKIYITCYKDTFLSIIHYPDSIDCGFEFVGVTLGGRTCRGGLPNFSSSLFYQPEIDFKYKIDCENNVYSFLAMCDSTVDQLYWIVRDSSNLDTIHAKNVSYSFSHNGIWTVELFGTSGSTQLHVTKQIEIFPSLSGSFLGRDTFYCSNEEIFMELDVSVPFHCVHWNGEELNLVPSEGPVYNFDRFQSSVHTVDSAGQYTVKVVTKNFCTYFDTLTVSEIPAPNKPEIQLSDHELQSTISSYKYHWFRNNVLIKADTNSNLDPETSGFYRVQLESEHGCFSEISDSIYVDLSAIQDITAEDIRIYPNPSDGLVYIDIPGSNDYTVVVLDYVGRTIAEYRNQSEIILDIPGFYFLKIRIGNNLFVKCVVVQ